jgi:hypothetical protein
MARQHPAQVMGLGRADPVDDLQAGARGGLGQGDVFHLRKTVHRRDRLAAAPRLPSPASTRTVWALVIGKVDPDQPSSSILLPPWPWCLLGGGFAGAALAHGHGPKGAVSDDGTHACAATGPDPPGSGHFLIRGIRGRPRAAIRRTRLSAPAPSSEGDPTPPPEPAGMRMQPWDLGTDQAPRSLTSGQQWWTSGPMTRSGNQVSVLHPAYALTQPAPDKTTSIAAGQSGWWAWLDLNLGPHPDPRINGVQARGSIRAKPGSNQVDL